MHSNKTAAAATATVTATARSPEQAVCHCAQAPDTLGIVVSNHSINADYRHLILQADARAATAAAGQFFHLLCPASGSDTPFFRRPMSIYRADPHAGVVEFLYKVTGAGTRGLATLRPGDGLPMLGPLGIGFTLQAAWKHIVVLGRGVGLATLAPLSDLAVQNGLRVTAILSARDAANLMSQSRFRNIGAEVIEVVDSDGSSAPDNIERILRRLHASGRADAFFTCGSNRLTMLMQKLGGELGVPGEVALEQQMACGLGMCYCCVRAFKQGKDLVSKRVCWDGPVFPIAEVMI
jgi:dihydroorotate dehydrogenase electron transfer subunit